MPIPITCPSCLTRFSVSEKFAGKSGPCPKCKAVIKIPEKSDEIVIHAPTDALPKDSKGKSVLKPIRREEAKLSLPVVLAAVLGSIAIFSVAFGLRLSPSPTPTMLLGAAAPLLAMPLVYAGYWFLRDDELQGFMGKELWIRCAICALVFALGWAIYSWVPGYVDQLQKSLSETSPLMMGIMIGVMIALGTAAATLSLELELLQGLLLYLLYFFITFVLTWLTGTPLGEILPGKSANGTAIPTRPSIVQPAEQAPATAQPPPAQPETPPVDIPKLLQ